jgi:endoglucanase
VLARVSVRSLLAVLSVLATLLVPGTASAGQGGPGGGQVVVRGRDLLRDGHPWVPHGFYQIAFEVAPANLAHADHPFWANAYQHYSPDEYRQMRAAGADSVRLQIAQVGADPKSPQFDRGFLDKALCAIDAARRAGLTVIVSVQDETHVPGDRPIDLPDDGTRRVWQEIAPRFARDRGVLYELLNEPRPAPNPPDWQRWAQAMNATIHTVRAAGAGNVVIADGLAVGHVIDGAPALADPQVAYASHPYALPPPRPGTPAAPWQGPPGQREPAWQAQFGTFAQHAPVIITEWLSGGYYCNGETPESTVRFLQYLQRRGIGLEVGTWDWAPGGFGSARWHFPGDEVSSFAGRACHQPGYGLGAVVQAWYRTGTPPSRPL